MEILSIAWVTRQQLLGYITTIQLPMGARAGARGRIISHRVLIARPAKSDCALAPETGGVRPRGARRKLLLLVNASIQSRLSGLYIAVKRDHKEMGVELF